MAKTQENIYKHGKKFDIGMREIESIKIIDNTYEFSELELLAFEIAKENDISLVETKEGLNPIDGIYYRELIGENQEIDLKYKMTCSLALEPGAKLPLDAIEKTKTLIDKQQIEETLIIKKKYGRRTIMRLADYDPGFYSFARSITSISRRTYTLSEIKALFL